VAGGWRRLHSEELNNFYASPNIRMIRSKRIRWAGHAARMVEIRMCTEFWLESVKGTDHSKDLGVDGRIKSEWMLGR